MGEERVDCVISGSHTHRSSHENAIPTEMKAGDARFIGGKAFP